MLRGRGILIFVVVLLLFAVCAVPAYSKKPWEQDKAEPAAATPKITGEETKNLLAANVNAMRNQELRVAVLQQILNEEGGKLTQMQALFSDQYKLDPEKLRAGKYQFDAKTGKFTEKKD